MAYIKVCLPFVCLLFLVTCTEQTRGTDRQTATVTLGNAVPIAHAGSDQTATVGETITLDGSASTDRDGDRLHFSWHFIKAPPESTAELSDTTAVMSTFVADVAGQYVIALQVRDPIHDSALDTVTVTTAPGNTAPLAQAGPDQTVDLGATTRSRGSWRACRCPEPRRIGRNRFRAATASPSLRTRQEPVARADCALHTLGL